MNIVLIFCHPDPNSLNAALANAYEQGAISAGHTVRRLNIYDMDFDPSLYRSGSERQELEPVLVEAQKTIEWGNHLVLVFPMWWYGLPARLKGFVDKTFLPGWAFKYHPKGFLWDKLLAGRSARAVYTMDTPPILARLVVGDPVWRELQWGILGFVGFKPIRRTIFGPVKRSTPEIREGWIKKMKSLGTQAK